MIRFIWQNWWRNKERFLLLLVGALIISSGLSYLVGTSQANKGTVVDELQKRWHASYDIVVRPPGTRSVTEDKHLLEPNYLSGLSGGITMDQYHTIQSLPDVKVAAPIAMIGYTDIFNTFKTIHPTTPGVYRIRTITTNDIGPKTYKESGNLYFTVGWDMIGTGKEYGVMVFSGNLSNGTSVLLAGVDPTAENELVGLKNSVVKAKAPNSHYFKTIDNENGSSAEVPNIPILLSDKEFSKGQTEYDIQRLDLPFGDNQTSKTMEMVKKKGGEKFLDTVKAKDQKVYKISNQQAHKMVVNYIKSLSYKGGPDSEIRIPFSPSPINYEPVTSPFAQRWPYAYEVKPYTVPKKTGLAVSQSYRPVHENGDFSQWPQAKLNFIGLFDPTKLNISKDPTTQLPMETYFPSKASLVLDSNGNPVNPPVGVGPENDEYGFLTKPPLMLTTIDAAAKILGDKPISSIRIKVQGVTQMNANSQKVLDKVAKEIETKTGLIADVTLGSSPQPALTHIPGIDGKPELGWVEQPWIKIGAAMSIFQEAKVGLSGILASVILVAIVYVFSSNLISMYARRREFAVLLALGWRRGQLSKMIMLEAFILGLFVSLVSWAILGAFFIIHHVGTTGLRVLLIGLCGLAIYFLGSLIPAFLVRKIKPYDAMRSGEVSSKSHRFFSVKSYFSLSLSYLLTNWKRSVLSILSIALPTSLLIVFLFITFRLKGVMYATWLGQYVALEVGTMQYIAMAVAMLIAVLTTAEIMWQNISERQPEMALFKAVGWQSSSIRWLVLLEGAISGLIAGFVGLILAMGILWALYHHIPYDQLPFLILTLIIPIVTGVVGALIPAEKAVKISPSQGMQGGYNNEVKNEKRLKIAIGFILVVLFIGFITLIAYSVPELKQSNIHNPMQNVQGTKGQVNHSKTKKVTKSEPLKKSKNNKTHEGEKELKAGDKYTFSDQTYFIFKKPVPTPKDATLPKLKKNMKFISIPIQLVSNKDYSMTYKGYYKIKDKNGNTYDPVLRTLLKSKNWTSYAYINPPAEANTILTYMVPKSVTHFKLVVDEDWLPGLVTVNY